MISKIASKYLEFLTSNRLHKIASSYLYKQSSDPTYYKDRDDYIKNGKSGWSMGALDSPQAQNYRAVDYDEWLSNGGVHKPIPKGDAPAQTSQPSSPVQQTQPQPVVQPQVPVNTGKTETQMRFENAIKAKEIDDVNRNATNIVNNYEDLASKMPKTKGGSAPAQTPQPVAQPQDQNTQPAPSANNVQQPSASETVPVQDPQPAPSVDAMKQPSAPAPVPAAQEPPLVPPTQTPVPTQEPTPQSQPSAQPFVDPSSQGPIDPAVEQPPQPQPATTPAAPAAPTQTPVQPQESAAPTVPAGVGVNSTQTAANSGQQSAARKSMSDYKDRADFIKNGTEGHTLGDARGRLYRAKLWDYRQMANSVRQAAEDNNVDRDSEGRYHAYIEDGKVTNINGQTIR